MINMKAELICYSLGKISDSERSSFKREFLGYIDKSNNGVYTYKRDGLLGKIPHLKPSRGVIIHLPLSSGAVRNQSLPRETQ
jgi:hypothetical protein